MWPSNEFYTFFLRVKNTVGGRTLFEERFTANNYVLSKRKKNDRNEIQDYELSNSKFKRE